MTLSTTILRAGATVLSPRGARARLAVLMYHRVLTMPDALTGEVHASDFDVQMRALRECFNVLPLAEASARLANGTLPARSVAITFDDGYADNALVAVPILKRHGLHATFFVANGYLNGGRMFNDTVIEAVRRARGPALELSVAGLPSALPVGSVDEKKAALGRILGVVKYLEPEQRTEVVAQVAHAAGSPLPHDLMMNDGQVRSLIAAGMDVGGHTINHPILKSVDLDTARREIEGNRRALGAIIGKLPDMFAYPNGSPGKDYAYAHTKLVREAGYKAAVTTSWGTAWTGCDLYQLPRFTPWDRSPRRFVLRLLENLARHRAVLLNAGDVAGAAA
jgi:peptidoglycan/xylan/chitin deacetylase (PgdA/CDA1 family)